MKTTYRNRAMHGDGPRGYATKEEDTQRMRRSTKKPPPKRHPPKRKNDR